MPPYLVVLSCAQIPMAVVVQPMAHVGPYEDPVPVVDFGELT